MKQLVLNITNRCNFSCHHCLREGASDNDIDPELVAAVLPDLVRLGVRTVSVTGGEPILHPRFAEILAILERAGLRVGIVSNGWSGYRYQKVIEPFRRSIEYLAVSLDSDLEHEHDRLRRPGSFARALTTVHAFLADGYRVNLGHIVSRRTAGRLLAFGNFIADLDVRLSLGRVIATPGNREWQLDDKQKRQLRIAMALLRSKLGSRLHTTTSLGLADSLAFCSNFVTMDAVALRFDGAVMFCCDCVASNHGGVLGNLGEQPLATILRRFPARLQPILEARIEAQSNGRHLEDNDCDFCNRVLGGLGDGM